MNRLWTSWSALLRRVAVAAGALAALLSLLNDTPLWVASVRGAGLWLAVLALAWVSRAWLAEPERAP